MTRYDHSKPMLAIIVLLIFYILHIHLLEPRVPLAQQSQPSENGRGATVEAPSRSLGPQIAIITMNTKETSYDILSLSNKHSYANRHDYDLKVDFEGPGPWHKLTMIENAIKLGRYDWIWWMDFDTLITNNTIKIADIVEEALQKEPNPDNVKMIFTADCFPMNTGSMIYRGDDPKLISFLNLVRQCGDANPHYSEQDCVRDVIGVNDSPTEHPVVSEEWSKKFMYVPQWKINAFPEEIECYDKDKRAWRKGDFVIHFAGAWAHVKHTKDPTGYLMEKYRSEILE